MTRTSQPNRTSLPASDSIIDRLMSLPDADAPDSVADDMDRAVAASLQNKLARSLRDAIETASRRGDRGA